MFLTRLSLANRLLVGLATLAIAVLGVFVAGALKQEMMPPATMPAAFVSVGVDGVAPEEMSRTATEPLEAALRAVPGVTSVSSVTSTGSANVFVEWPFELDSEETQRAIRAAADGVKSSLPASAQLDIYSGSDDAAPSMQISAGSAGDEFALAAGLTQKVAPALKSIPGVQKVDVAGQQEQRIVVDLRPADVERLKVDPTQIKTALEAKSIVHPAGQAPSETGPTSITVGTTVATLEDVQNLPVPIASGTVPLRDFADVKAEKIPVGSLSRVNGKPSLTMTVTIAPGANVVQVSHAVTAELTRLAPELKAEFTTLFDQAPIIEQSIHDLTVEGGLGLLFAILVVLAFLASWRSTVIAAVSIPLSLLISLIGLYSTGNTLNMLTLGALTIAVGRVVDDSIVVIENINRHAQVDGVSVPGIIGSVRQVAGAITASTLTTVAVFLPIVFVSGPTGQLYRPFAVTVSIALLASLLVALTIVPVLAYWFLNRRSSRSSIGVHAMGPAASDVARSHRDADEINAPEDRLQRVFMPRLQVLWRRRVLTVTASVVLLGVTVGLATQIPTEFLDSAGNETLQIDQFPETAAAPPAEDPTTGAAPEGQAPAPVSAPSTAEVIASVEPVEKMLGKVEGVADVSVSIPVGAPDPSQPQLISYTLMLDRGADSEAVGDRVRAQLDKRENSASFQVSSKDSFSSGGGKNSAIDLRIQGNDPAALREASAMLVATLSTAESVKSVRSELSGEQSVVRVKLDEARAATVGIDRAMVAGVVKEALEGTEIGRLMFEGAERSILLRTPGTERTAAQIGEILLPVTPQQTEAAQKAARDARQQKADAEAAAARQRTEAEQAKQVADAERQRRASAGSLRELRAQLAALAAAPIVPSPTPEEPSDPGTPEDAGRAQAEREREEQLTALQSAIADAESSVTAADDQIAQSRQAQRDQAAELAAQQKDAAEQAAIDNLRGTPLKVGDIAAVENELVPPVVFRAEGERKVSLTIDPRKGKLDAANAAVQAAIEETTLPAGVTFEIGGVSAQKDEAFTQLGLAMILAIMLVLIVMIGTFRNFRQPLVLLVSIPFAATGAILGLQITGTPMGTPALIGLLMLVGIVVTNAIVLMDLINRLRADGVPLADAVTHGTRLRLRPILMTATATIFALVPMSLGLTGGGAFISRPLAIVVIGGLISSTLLTLVLVPIIYTAMESRRERRLERSAAMNEDPVIDESAIEEPATS
ncbi:efflux RND transporter permease subunit [Microbacterium sp. NPDC058269]|uniref:efflux RND transporter permease subunit n=1 Tax=Microbacterium sp. NPDC058269 TaxID=3346414 RepID=UPI0036D8BB87